MTKRRQDAEKVPELGAPNCKQVHVKKQIGLRLSTCKIPVMIMLVKVSDQERRRNLLSEVSFLVMTLVPWGALLWLIWPRR